MCVSTATKKEASVSSNSETDAETFYSNQRSVASIWGIVLPSWDDLSFHERLEWEDKLNEQEARDSRS